ncbi:MAG TPA: glycosyltransferase family 39 protein [Phycisphaerae bacterium]|nr:glycosyltransferase family 39 protein [Phycisphaerae bacterium]
MSRPIVIVALLGLALLAGLAPMTASDAFYDADEPHFAEGAFHMLRDGEWLIPKNMEGAVRLRKPPLVYWITAGLFAAFGPSPLAARAHALTAAALTLVATMALARRVAGDRARGSWAAAVLATAVLFLLYAMRALSDPVLTLAMVVSAWGLTGVVLQRRRDWASCLAAYGGAALAVLAKGLLPVVFVLYFWIAGSILRRRIALPAAGGRPSRWAHPVSLLGGVALAGWWFVVVAILHGGVLLDQFFGDQLTKKAPLAWWRPLANVPWLALLVAAQFLPWLLIVGTAAWRKRLRAADARSTERAFGWLAAGWVLLVVLIFGSGRRAMPRYLLPALPLAAVALACMLRRVEASWLTAWLRALRGVAMVLLCGLAAMACVAQWQFHGPASLPVLLAGVALLAVWWWLTRRRGAATPTALAFGMMLGAAALFAAVLPVISPSQSRAFVQYLRARGIAPDRPMIVIGQRHVRCQTRLLLGGTATLDHSRFARGVDLTRYEAVIVDTERTPPDSVAWPDGWRVDTVGALNSQIKVGPLIGAVFRGRLSDYVNDHRRTYFIGTPPRTSTGD